MLVADEENVRLLGIAKENNEKNLRSRVHNLNAIHVGFSTVP
jgi:hypothetical protein